MPYSDLLIASVAIAILYVAYRTVHAIYHLYFHPLAKFPGPRAAVLSGDWLYRVSQEGNPEGTFAELHRAYGSQAIRIGPNELHLTDTSLYKTIYSQDGRYAKDEVFYKAFANEEGSFETRHMGLHKVLRQKLAPNFSPANVLKSQNLIATSLIDLAAKIKERSKGQPVDMVKVCRLFPPDVIIKVVFGESDVIAVSDDDWDTPVWRTFEVVASSRWLRVCFPFTRWFQDMLPLGLIAHFDANLRSVKEFLELCVTHVQNFRSGESDIGRTPVLSSIDDLPDSIVIANAGDLVGGGAETTGYTMAFASWHILRDTELAKRLVAELDPIFDAAAPGMPGLKDLEAAPVLSAIIRESLRNGPAWPGRIPRVVPNHEDGKAPLIVDGQVVPPGTTVGISSTTMHNDPKLWGSNPSSFNIDRWLEPDAATKASYLVGFGKGLRNCVGQNLAMAELYMGLAFLFRTYSYELQLQPGQQGWTFIDRVVAQSTTPFMVKMTQRKAVPTVARM